jgi:hypothetical protein
MVGWRFAFHDVAPDVLMDLTYMFGWDEPGRDPAIDAFTKANVRPLVDQWKAHQATHGCTLGLLHGPRETVVVHGRLGAPSSVVRYSGAAAFILRACGAIRSRTGVLAAVNRGTADAAGTFGEESLDQQGLDFFITRWRKAGVPVHEPELPAAPQDVFDTLAGDGLLMREGGSVLTLPLNYFRMVHGEIVSGDPLTLLAYLTLPAAESQSHSPTELVAAASPVRSAP